MNNVGNILRKNNEQLSEQYEKSCKEYFENNKWKILPPFNDFTKTS